MAMLPAPATPTPIPVIEPRARPRIEVTPVFPLYLMLVLFVGSAVALLDPILAQGVYYYLVFAVFAGFFMLFVRPRILPEGLLKSFLERVLPAAILSYSVMLGLATLVAILAEYVPFVTVAYLPLIAFAFYGTFCETLFYIAAPMALYKIFSRRYPKLSLFLGYFFAGLFALVFGILHMMTHFGLPKIYLAQYVIAAIVNFEIARRYKTIVGIALGHFLTDLTIFAISFTIYVI